jgi:phenylalanyl-tRNA synthetase beta chain
MPKIEASLPDLLRLARIKDPEGLAERLEPLKAELDGIEGDTVKIELNDTNRPDLWTVEGVARGLRCWEHGAGNSLDHMPEPTREIMVHHGLEGVRPFIASFVCRGPALGERGLAALVGAQEKLCATMGRERRTAAVGFYRLNGIEFPVHYRAVPPETLFRALGTDREMTLKEVLGNTEAGMKYAGLLRGFEAWPFLSDDRGTPLSFPPVLNSEGTGRVVPEDGDLFCEVTGTDLHTVQLLSTILACDLEDRGASIEPVRVVYPNGNAVVTPVIHTDTLTTSLPSITETTGLDIPGPDLPGLLGKMDYRRVTVDGGEVTAVMPPYRRDGIHPRDLVEDITIAYGLNRIEPLLPGDYTLGRASAESMLASSVKLLLVGAGCEEIIRPVLTSAQKITGLTLTPGKPVSITNPMTAEYSVVSNTLLPCLLEVESVSGHAAFPHRLFTVGEVLVRTPEGRLITRWNLGIVTAGAGMDFGSSHSLLGLLAHGRGLPLKLEACDDSRFIPGRCARVFLDGIDSGVIGEFHPAVLTAWGIPVPASGLEVTLEALRG